MEQYNTDGWMWKQRKWSEQSFNAIVEGRVY